MEPAPGSVEVPKQQDADAEDSKNFYAEDSRADR
jgi:hypothetical protein